MDNISSPSSSTDALAHIPCVIHHRDGGYLCLEPKSNGSESAAIAFDRDIIPYKKYILQPKGCTSMMPSEGRRLIRTKTDFFKVLDQLIGKEVAIKDAETLKYLTSEQSIYGKPNAKFKENAQFFHIGRTDTGAYYFRTSEPKKELYLHKSSKTKSWAMKGLRGPTMKIEIDIDTSQVNFSSVDKTSNSNDWIIEPDDSIILLDSLPTEKEQNPILFLGVVDINSAENIIEVPYHFRNVPAAWRSKEQWGGAIHSIKKQHSRGFEFCIHTDYVGSKTKWIARCAPEGKLCVVIASSNFHQEHLEECVDKMEDMLMLGQLTATDLSELGCQVQIKEVQSTEEDRKKLLENARTSGAASTFQHMKDVPISLMHRSGGWFSLQKDDSGPDLLYLEPIQEDQGEEINSKGNESIKNAGDYFGQMKKYSRFALKNERGDYLFSRERKNVFGKEKNKNLFRKKYLVAEYAELKLPEETPETFVFGQNFNSGGISIMSTSKGCFLSRNRRGEFVFMAQEEDSDAAEVTCSANEGAWFIDAADLHSGVTSDGLLFACVVRQHGKKTLVSRHAPDRPTAWRTTESWDYITDVLLENMKKETSTAVTDSDTGHKWFATNSDGKELFIVIATEGFPLHYGTKAIMALEDLYRTLDNDDNRPPSSSEVYRLMRDIETEYRYELCFGNSEVLGLIQDVEELTDKMMANIDGLKENIAIEQEIEEKARQLHALAQQFKKKANKKKWSVAAAAVAGGAVAGGVFGLVIGCPAGVIVLESQLAEIALSASLCAAPGVMKGIVLLSTDQFWKRKFVNLGKCIDSRRQKRARGKKMASLEQKRAENRFNIEHDEKVSLL